MRTYDDDVLLGHRRLRDASGAGNGYGCEFRDESGSPSVTRFDRATFHREVYLEARRAFTALAERYSDQEFCGYALYSDEDAMTVCYSVNTVDHLTRAKQEVEQQYPGEAEYLEWSPAEWAFENEGPWFNQISKKLAGLGFVLNGDEFTQFPDQRPPQSTCQFRDDVFNSCVDVLESLVAEGFFPSSHDHVVVFAISDFDVDPERETGWIRRLNPAAVADRFSRLVGGPSDSSQRVGTRTPGRRHVRAIRHRCAWVRRASSGRTVLICRSCRTARSRRYRRFWDLTTRLRSGRQTDNKAPTASVPGLPVRRAES